MSPNEQLARVYVVVFVVELIFALTLLGMRAIQYHLAGWKLPVLFPRDLFLFLSWAWLTLLIFIRRAADLQVVDEVWWTLITSTPVVVSLAYWIYKEIRLGLK